LNRAHQETASAPDAHPGQGPDDCSAGPKSRLTRRPWIAGRSDFATEAFSLQLAAIFRAQVYPKRPDPSIDARGLRCPMRSPYDLRGCSRSFFERRFRPGPPHQSRQNLKDRHLHRHEEQL
jgi:hypothetical protein